MLHPHILNPPFFLWKTGCRRRASLKLWRQHRIRALHVANALVVPVVDVVAPKPYGTTTATTTTRAICFFPPPPCQASGRYLPRLPPKKHLKWSMVAQPDATTPGTDRCPSPRSAGTNTGSAPGPACGLPSRPRRSCAFRPATRYLAAAPTPARAPTGWVHAKARSLHTPSGARNAFGARPPNLF